jgi:hypothetical protein
LNEKKECTGFHLKSMRIGIFLIVLLLAAIIMIPTVGADNKNIRINITSPKEGEVYLVGDVIPPYIPISVLGVIDAPYGIQNITLSNGIGKTVCGFTPGNHSDIRCDIQLDLLTVDQYQFTISVFDKQGNSARIVRNYSFKINQQEPPETTNIFIYGKVTDTDGRAISGVEIVIEPLSAPPNFEDYVKKTTTAENGTYRIEDGSVVSYDYERNISVIKEGYIPIKQKITVVSGNGTYEQNFILTPQNPTVSGFGFPLGIFAVFIGLLIITIRKR